MTEGFRFDTGQQPIPAQLGDLELYDHLSGKLEPVNRGIKDDLISNYPNPDLIIPVMVAGVSLGSKTTALSQLWEEQSRDPMFQKWHREHGLEPKYYFLDTGMVRELGSHLGIIKNQQGGLSLEDYRGLSDLTEELVPLGLEYLRGPGQLGLEFVWVTAILNNQHEVIGTPRGSLRLAQRLVANANGRLMVIITPEYLKDIMGEHRENGRKASPAQAKQIANAAGNIHSVQDPEQIHAMYMLSSNKATRIQQAHGVGTGIFAALPDQLERFGTFENFKAYYFDPITGAVLKERYPEWEQLTFRHHEKWLETIFHRPSAQIDISRGAVILNDTLVAEPEVEEEVEEAADQQPPKIIPRHLYDSRLIASGFYRALIDRSEEPDEPSLLRAAVRRLELKKLKAYFLT